MKKEMKLDIDTLEIDLEGEENIENFIFSNQSFYNVVAKYFRGTGYVPYWASKEKNENGGSDFEDQYAKGFRVCTRETDPEAANAIMGPVMEGSSNNEEIRRKEMVLMKMPEKRYNAFLNYYNKETEDQKRSADINKKMTERGAPFSTFNENKSSRGHSFGN